MTGRPPVDAEDRPHPELAACLAHLRQGNPFAAHEDLEAAWRREGDVLCRQDAARGLIQLCAAFVQRGRGNPYGARVLAMRARERLGLPAPAHVDAALCRAGIDRPLLAARLGTLPGDVGRWPPPWVLVTGRDNEEAGPS